ncbi:hypothetical protein LDENG_00178840, partial [Lucifuga dentata]
VKEDLIRRLLDADVHVAAAESFSADACSSLTKMKAYQLNLFGRRYQWILMAGGGVAAVGRRPQVSGCRADSVLSAADGSIRLQIRALSHTNTPSVSGRTAQEYDAYISQLMQSRSKVSPLHAFAYDAVWVAAKALSQVTEAVKRREKYGVQRNVSEEEVQTMLLQAVKEMQFEGVTGPVFFQNGERMASIDLIQLQGSGPAKDQTIVRLQRRNVSFLLYGAVSSAAVVTIIIALSVLCLSISRHRRRLQSGRRQEALLLLGILLSSSSVLLSGLDGSSLSDATFDLVCSVRLWTLSVGHTASFAMLFAETWQLYSCHVTAGTKHTQPERACFLDLWLFLLDVFVLISWQILDPLRRAESQYSLESDAADPDVRIIPFTERCSSSNMDLWLAAGHGFKAPLLGLGCFLAWSIRSSQEVGVAGAKPLAVCVAAVTLSSGVGVTGSLLTSHNPPLQFCLTAAVILCCNTFIMAAVFGPKVSCREPHGNTAALRGDAAAPHGDVAVLHGEAAARTTTQLQLNSLNRQLRRRAAQLDADIQTVTMQLHRMSESDTAQPRRSDVRTENGNGEVCYLTSTQISADERNSDRKRPRSDDINAPERVGRRLSLQLPILHYSYLAVVGGVSSSCSSLFGSQEAFVSQHAPTTTTKTTASRQVISSHVFTDAG